MLFPYLLSWSKSFKSILSNTQTDNLNFLRKLLTDDVDFPTLLSYILLSHINFRVLPHQTRTDFLFSSFTNYLLHSHFSPYVLCDYQYEDPCILFFSFKIVFHKHLIFYIIQLHNILYYLLGTYSCLLGFGLFSYKIK